WYATVRSFWPCRATASPRCCTPVITHGPKPVTVFPGLMLTLALMTPPLMHVTDWPAMMPFGAAVPSGTSGGLTVAGMNTEAKPDSPPPVARTVLGKLPGGLPAGKDP